MKNYPHIWVPDACPMSNIRHQTEEVRDICYKLFWKPSLEKVNKLWWLHGSVFTDFLTKFQNDTLPNIDIISPEEMVYVESLGDGLVGELCKMAFETQWVSKVSQLAFLLYKRFIKEYIDTVPARNTLEDTMNKLHMLWFTITFIQAFDAIFFTWLRWVSTLEEWGEIKEDMWKSTINLAVIPTNVQEWLTSSHEKISYHFWEEKPYMLEHILEIIRIQAQTPEMSFSGDIAWIRERGWYGRCPALNDGTLKKAFDMLFDIYWKVFLSQ